MTAETRTAPVSQSADTRAAAVRALLETLRDPGGSAQAVRSMLATANLSTEQAGLIDTLLQFGVNDGDEPEATALDPDDGEPTGVAARPGQVPRHVRHEVANLRRANDTIASALGACPICWGGDPTCKVCEGQGRAGYAAPDPALFREFVLPAVQRVRGLMRSPPRRRRG